MLLVRLRRRHWIFRSGLLLFNPLFNFSDLRAGGSIGLVLISYGILFLIGRFSTLAMLKIFLPLFDFGLQILVPLLFSSESLRKLLLRCCTGSLVVILWVRAGVVYGLKIYGLLGLARERLEMIDFHLADGMGNHFVDSR